MNPPAFVPIRTSSVANSNSKTFLHMEESPIIDSPTESKPPFLALGLGVVALVLGGVSLIMTVRTRGSVDRFEKESLVTDATALTKKIEDSEQGIVTLKQELAAQRNENAALQSKIKTLESSNATFTNWINTVANPRLKSIAPGAGPVAPPPVGPRPPVPPVGNPVAHPVANPGTGGNTVAVAGLYTVRSGDNFSKIAAMYGVTVSAIEVANPGVESRKLQPGKKIKIPAKDTSAPSRPVAPPPRTPVRPAIGSTAATGAPVR
jgi:LysM repeat protein